MRGSRDTEGQRGRRLRCPALLLLLAAFCAGCDKGLLKEKVLQSRGVDYRTLSIPASDEDAGGAAAVPARIPLAAVSADCELLCYLLQTAYAAYDSAAAAGFDDAAAMQQIEASCALHSRNGTVSTAFFSSLIVQALSPFILDGHFAVYAGDYSVRLSPRSVVYYAPVFVRDGFVFRSEAESVAEGERYTGSSALLLPYPAAGEGVFRAGILSSGPLDSVTLEVEGQARAVPVRCDGSCAAASVSVRTAETADSAYIFCSSFQLPPAADSGRRAAEEQLAAYVAAADACRGKKNIVMDIRGNSGGNNIYPMQFFYRLYLGHAGHGRPEQELARLAYYDQNLLGAGNFSVDSPATAQAWLSFARSGGNASDIAFREKRLLAQQQEPALRKLSVDVSPLESFALPELEGFCGTIYMLVDRYTASAAENAVVFAQHLFGGQRKVFLVGENSAGCMMSGDVLRYRLPASGITLAIPSKDFSAFARAAGNFRGEGEGFFPDFWATRQDMPAALAALTGDGALAALVEPP